MELKDRIQQIMNHEKLSASVFADSIGVQRSSISHIISGRNKPSLEFIQKILISYPKYNAEWLVMGIGDMHNIAKPINEIQALENTPNNSNSELFPEHNSPTLNTELNSKKNASMVSDEEVPTYKSEEKLIAKHANTPSAPIKKELKSIDRIVIFYTDNSFSVHNPE